MWRYKMSGAEMQIGEHVPGRLLQACRSPSTTRHSCATAFGPNVSSTGIRMTRVDVTNWEAAEL
jgi:hypothetical protein